MANFLKIRQQELGRQYTMLATLPPSIHPPFTPSLLCVGVMMCSASSARAALQVGDGSLSSNY